MKPKDSQIKGAGEIIQLDTPDVRPLFAVCDDFTACDNVFCWDRVNLHNQAVGRVACFFCARMYSKVLNTYPG